MWSFVLGRDHTADAIGRTRETHRCLFYIREIRRRIMIRITEENVYGPMYDSNVFSGYFSGLKVVVADIEATGLSPRSCSVILGGAVSAFDAENRKVFQYFADTKDDEQELLERYCGFLSEFDVIITYNGDTYDLPFLKKRMKKHKLDSSGLDRLYSMDMYRVIKKHSQLGRLLPDLKQKTVERYMGLSDTRSDLIDGKMTAELYEDYHAANALRSEEILGKILLHNRDDVVQLSDIMGVLRNIDLHKVLFTEGIPLHAGDAYIRTGEIKLNKNRVEVECDVYGAAADLTHYGEGFEFILNAAKGRAVLKIQCEEAGGHMVADVKALGIDDETVRHLGGYESGFLILKDKNGKIKYQEVNRLVIGLLNSVLQ